MEFFWLMLPGITFNLIFFTLGVFLGPKVKKIFSGKDTKTVIEAYRKPQNKYSSYTLKELEGQLKHLEVDYKNNLPYTLLREDTVQDLKEVKALLDWYYTTNGTKALEEQRAANQRELEAFDQQYKALLKE